MENLLVSSDSGIPGVELPGLFEFLSVFFLATLRIGAFLISAPFFCAQSIPLQVRIVSSIILGMVFFEQFQSVPLLELDNLVIVRIIFVELLIGLTVGILLSILFASVALAGEKIATSGGLGFAAQIDPTTGGQTPVISNALTLFSIVTFLSLDGHLALIRAMDASFSVVAVGGRLDLYAASQFVIESAGYMFELASVMMLPVVIVLLLTNVTVGVVTRSAPTLNLFSFGFPITLLVCFLALYLATKPLGYSMEYLVGFAIDFIASFFGKLKNG